MPKASRLIVLFILTCAGVCVTTHPSVAQRPSGNDSGSAILETRIAVDADSCPTAVEIWLVSTTDTIPAMELVLAWDRPDFARFKTEAVTLPRIDTLVSGKSPGNAKAQADSVIVKPVLRRQGGLVDDWEYAEARGASGLSVKIAAFASLTAGSGAKPLLPSESGLLFTLPVEVLPKPPMDMLGDSAAVGMSPEATRLSDIMGNLIDHIVLRSSAMRTPPCWSSLLHR